MNYIKWEELDNYIGEPIWNLKMKTRFILDCYKRYFDKCIIVNG